MSHPSSVMMFSFLRVSYLAKMLLVFFLLHIITLYSKPISLHDFNKVAERGNYTCDELKRWLGSEKHYSNSERKKYFFSLLQDDSKCNEKPSLLLSNMSWGWDMPSFTSADDLTLKGKKKGGKSSYSVISEKRQCGLIDKKAVVFLSNFSIKHNFSHFLHALLRLFCALVDARYLVWDQQLSKFTKQENFTLWLDEFLPTSQVHMQWY